MRMGALIGIFLLITQYLLYTQPREDRGFLVESTFDWQHTLMQANSGGDVLILGVGTFENWEFLNYNLSNELSGSHIIEMDKAFPTVISSYHDVILIGGQSADAPCIWEYHPADRTIQNLNLAFPVQGTLIELLSQGEDIFMIISSDTSWLLYHLKFANPQLMLIDQVVKRSAEEKIRMVRNSFGELYLIQSSKIETERSSPILRKYNVSNALIWKKSYPSIKGSMDDLAIRPDGDIIGIGTINLPFKSNSFFARWAPNGRLSNLSNQENLDKYQNGYLGVANDNLLWKIHETIPFAGRMGDILITQNSINDFGSIANLRIGEKYHEEILACCADDKGNAILLYRSGKKHNAQIRLKYYEINPDPCDRILPEGEPFRLTYTSSSSFSSSNDQYDFTAHLTSKQKISPSKIRIHLIESAAKAPESTNITLLDSSNNQFCYALSKSIFLSPGENKIQISITSEKGRVDDTMSVYYLLHRPNLYIFSVGVVYEDLNYTDKDAADFISLFSDQEGRLFDRVSVELLNTKELTTAKNIVNHLEEFAKNNQINDEDLIFVFFSSHGELIDDEFVILASDYEFENPLTVVRFNKQIISQLEKLKGKKILFLDACKSGNLKGINEDISPELISTIFRVIQSTPGIMAISSSSDQQSSYEIKDLQNGVFTAAIKEMFSNNQHQYDLNDDQVLTVFELFQYLQSRVPQLVAQYFKDPNKQQVPNIPIESLDLDLPIFYLSNKKQ